MKTGLFTFDHTLHPANLVRTDTEVKPTYDQIWRNEAGKLSLNPGRCVSRQHYFFFRCCSRAVYDTFCAAASKVEKHPDVPPVQNTVGRLHSDVAGDACIRSVL